MSEESRRASAAYALHDADNSVAAQGRAEAVVGEDGVSVGPVSVEFLDADTLLAADYRIAIGCWPSGTLVLSQLGRRFETFAAELRRARGHARIAGFLAHGVGSPTVFPGAVLGSGTASPVDCHLFDTHVTLLPDDADPWQVPLGTLRGIGVEDDPPAVVLETADGPTRIGRLARRRDEFHRALTERISSQASVLEGLTGSAGFADGLGVERSRLAGFERLVGRFTSPDRADCAEALLRAARGGEPRLGFVQLLDIEGESLDSPSALPEHWAAFLLVPAGPLAVLEILAGPAAATYVFAASLGDVNRDLQLLHFRRGALALKGGEAEPVPGNPWRLALRKLEPLKRLREVTRARLVHGEGWAPALERAVGGKQAPSPEKGE